MKRTVLLLAFVLTGGCSTLSAVNTASETPVSQATLNQARGTSQALHAAYLMALDALLVWENPRNRCNLKNALPPPACSTAQGVLKAEAVRVDVRATLDRLDAVVADVSTTPTMLTAAISAVQNSMALFSQVTKGG